MLELLFLLLPVAAAYGWFMALYSQKQKELRQKASVSKNFSSGLNFLLTDQEDKAIEQLLALLDIEAATLDTYLALANLFRRKGDWDKAIKIHEKLVGLKLAKPQLHQLKLELARDYFSAGLLDRSEQLLLELVLLDAQREAALKQLMALYQQTHDWHKVSALTHPIALTSSRSLKISAANMLLEANPQASVAELIQLQQTYPQALRPRITLAQRYIELSQFSEAADLIKKLLNEKPQWAADLLPMLHQCQLSADEWYQQLSRLSHQQKNISATMWLARWLVETGAGTAAEQLLLEKLQNQPNIRLFRELLAVRQLNQPEDAAALQSIEKLVQAYLDTKVLSSCKSCGFKTRQKYWLCPSCHQWESLEPISGIDGR